MGPLLNFVTIRNPRTPTPDELETGFIRYDPAIGAELLQRTADALQQGHGTEAARQLVAEFRGSDRFLSSDADLTERIGSVAEFAGWLATNATRLTWPMLDDRLERYPLEVGDDDRRLLWENLVAYLYGGGVSEVRETLVWALRGLHVTGWERERREGDALAARLAQATVLIPAEGHFRLEREPTPEEPTEPAPPEEEGARARERLASLERAHEELERALWETMERARGAGVPPPKQPRVESGCMVSPPEDGPPQPAGEGEEPAPEPPVLARLDDAVLERLSPETRTALEDLGVGTGARLAHALQFIEHEARRLGQQVWRSAREARRVVQVGGAFWMRAPTPSGKARGQLAAPARPTVATRNALDYAGFFGDHRRPEADTERALEAEEEECRIRPLGCGDFRRVEQRLCCYEAGEVAHIENVMEGETKERTTRRLLSSERFVSTVTEEETTEERDTQTTDRFQLEKETSKVIESDLSFEMGVNIAGQYGPVKLTADTKFATSSSTQESDRQASRYAKEVTDRALERVTRKVREERATRTIEEFEETNLHRLQAKTEHVVGLFRWVDKVYEAKVVNYGKRLMFEFLVPEPAAFHLHASIETPAEGSLSLEKPVDPRSDETWKVFGRAPLKSYVDVTAANYGLWAAAYEATVEPPPTFELTLGKAYHREGMDHNTQFADSKNDFKLTEGYEGSSFYASYGLHSENHNGGLNWMTLFVGRRSRFAQFGGTFSGFLDSEDDIVPILLMGRTRFYAVNLEINCRRSPRLVEQWQLKTFNAILTAYQNKLAAYETALAQAKAQVGIEIQGTNPLRNRDIEQIELEKSCLRLLTRCADLPSEAMHDEGECDYPEFKCCEAIHDGNIVQFFEQLFEWRLMTYQFYPYFWGRHCNWTKIYQLDDVDPLFLNFLQAGYARVIVPVREGYHAAAMRYLADGALWNGGTAPGVDSPMYVAIENDLKEPVGTVDPDIKPWEIRVPTSLTALQCGSGCVEGTGLPCPCKDENGDGKNGKNGGDKDDEEDDEQTHG
jgi:hypothetical protein